VAQKSWTTTDRRHRTEDNLDFEPVPAAPVQLAAPDLLGEGIRLGERRGAR
jgi:hypothetical protein